MSEITQEEYYQSFKEEDSSFSNQAIDFTKTKHFAALDRAWKNRDFEIDKYWSRATYFWAFIAAIFAGYIAINSSVNIDTTIKKHLSFMVNCMGIIFSLAWVLVNLGSKKWQENWEKHIDMLEDKVTGPLYKIVLNKDSYSVSRINISVSKFVLCIWVVLAFNELYTEVHLKNRVADYTIIITVLLTIGFVIGMIRSNKSNQGKSFTFNRRMIMYEAKNDKKVAS